MGFKLNFSRFRRINFKGTRLLTCKGISTPGTFRYFPKSWVMLKKNCNFSSWLETLFTILFFSSDDSQALKMWSVLVIPDEYSM